MADLTLNVMMLGGRRAGKTSVLAALQGCFEDIFADTNLHITTSNMATLDVIEAKRNEMKNYVAQAAANKDFFPDNTPSTGDALYGFDIGLKDTSGANIHIEFYDYPGEWIREESHFSEITNQIKKSDVLMVVIDTPYMMEESGQYCDQKNYCYRLTEAIKKNWDLNEAQIPKMLMFVPVKCEKYAQDNKLDLVKEKTQSEYKELINFCKEKSEILFLPIQTIGTVRFNRFERDAEQEFIMDSAGYPKNALYYFTNEAMEVARQRGLSQKFAANPKNCERPMVYTLVYVLSMVEKKKKYEKKKDNDIFGIFPFLRIFTLVDMVMKLIWSRFSFDHEDDFLKELKQIRKKLDNGNVELEVISDKLSLTKGE